MIKNGLMKEFNMISHRKKNTAFRVIFRFTVVATIFAGLAYFGVALTREGERTSAIWLANAFALALLLRTKSNLQILLVASCLITNTAVLLLVGDPPLRAAGIALINTIEIILMATVTTRFCGRTPKFDEFVALLRFTAISFAIPFLSGALVTIVLAWGQGLAEFSIWGTWVAAHALGFVIATPLVAIGIDNLKSARNLSVRHIISWITLFTVVTAVSTLIFSQSTFPFLFLACPLVIFAAFLTGVPGTAASVAIISIIAISATLMGHGPISLVRGGLGLSLLTLQLFLATNFLMGLPVAALLAERNAIKRNLDEAARFTASITDNLSEVIFRTDEKGRWIYLNPAWEVLTGMSVSDWIGKTSYRLIVPDDFAHAQAIFAQLAAGDISEAELRQRFRHADGTIRHIDVTVRRLSDENGIFTGAIGNIRDVSQMVAQQEILAASESRFRRIAESAPVGVFRADHRGLLTYINSAWASKAGMSADEMLGNGWMKAITDLSAFAGQPAWTDFKPGEIRRRTVGFRTVDGSDLFMEIVTSAEFDSTGNLLGFVGVAVDITRQKIANEQLADSERRFHALASLSPAGIFRTDIHGDYKYVNSAWMSLAGQEESAWEEKGWIDAIHSEDRQDIMAKWSGAVAVAGEFRSEFRFRRMDGSIAWVDALARPETDDAGNVVGFVGVVIDITERRQALEELARRDKELSLLAVNATDGIFRLSLDGICKYASPSAHNLLSVPADSLIGANLITGFHPDERVDVEAAFEALRAGTCDDILVAYRSERIGCPGQYIWLEANCGLVRNAAHEPLEIIASIRNISVRKALEDALHIARNRAEAAVEARSAFMANMSHEIRTPMNGVLGFTDVLLAGELTEKQRRQVEMIAESGRAMLRLLNDILDMSKIEAGQMTYAPSDVDLHHVLNSVTRMLQPSAEAKEIELDIFVAPTLPQQIVTDPLRFRQILLNLLSNAIKFTDHGQVHITAHRHEDDGRSCLQVSIKDSGIGMAADRLEAIFAPFMQAEIDTSQRFGGTGLGLSISQELARLLGGKISVVSEEGVGTTFTLTLPLTAADTVRVAPKIAETKIEYLRLADMRVLVAEDNDINQQLMRDMAVTLGIEIEIAGDGEQAIEAVRQAARAKEGYSILFMDLRMPGMGGLEATRRLRDLGYGADELPIIALTANAYQDDIEACMKAGMQGHLAKPLRLNDLTKMLAKYCGASDALEISPARSDRSATPSTTRDLEHRFNDRKRELFVQIEHAGSLQSFSPTDVEELADELHKVAGTAGLFDEEKLGEAAAQLEQALRAATLDEIPLIIENAKELLSGGK
jgi:PAS domain S-box-containing protein